MKVLYATVQEIPGWVKVQTTLYFKGNRFINRPIQEEIKASLLFLLEGTGLAEVIDMSSENSVSIFQSKLTFKVSKANGNSSETEGLIIEILSSYEESMNKLQYTGLRLMQ